MKKGVALSCLLLLLIDLLTGCAHSSSSIQSSARVAGKYYVHANELEDDVLWMKKNGKFLFYRKNALVPVARIGKISGNYQLHNDSIQMDWQGHHPDQIRRWLSNRCIADTALQELIFLDDLTSAEKSEMSLKQRGLKPKRKNRQE